MHEAKELKEKDRILEAALECFQKFGQNKTTLGDIANNLGYSRTKIYYYFKDKESVCRAALIKISASYFEDQETIVFCNPDVLVCIEKLLQNRVRYVLEIHTKGIFLLNFAQEFIESDERLKSEILEKEHLLYQKIIKRGVKEKIFKIKDIPYSTTLLLDSVSGYFHVLASKYRNIPDLTGHLTEIKEHTNAQIKFIIQSLK